MGSIDELRSEHGIIMRIFSILEQLGSGSGIPEPETHGRLEKVVEFLRAYVDQCHHAKEEEIFFPAIGEAGLDEMDALVKELTSEHSAGRKMVQEMEKALGQSRGSKASTQAFSYVASRYIGLFRHHIREENGILFPKANEKLTAEIEERILQGFRKIQREKIGEGKHAAFQRLVDEFEKAIH